MWVKCQQQFWLCKKSQKHFPGVILCAQQLVKCGDRSASYIRVTLVPSSGRGVNDTNWQNHHRNQASHCAVYSIILLLIQSQDTISTLIVWMESTGTSVRRMASSELALNTFHIMFRVCPLYISPDTIIIRNWRNNIFHICHTLSRLSHKIQNIRIFQFKQ